MTVDPELPVPPTHYGGIERIAEMLVQGLIAAGHDVTVFAHADSSTVGHLVPWPGRVNASLPAALRNAFTLARHEWISRFDIIHSFARVATLAPLLPLPLPKLMSYHRAISRRSVRLGHALSGGTLWFSAVSRWMMREVEDIGVWRLVFNGVPLATYSYRADPGTGAPFIFLGRLEEIKGPHLAIEVARRAGVPLVIAGNVPTEHRGWFDATIAPQIDGEFISYVGPVNDRKKNALLGRARALLMPILWEEPFGLVMAEAMACGTPVLGLRRGAVPEIVDDGITGFVVDDLEGLVTAAGRLSEIDRAACRSRVEQLFSEVAVVKAYLAVYAEMLTASPTSAAT